MKISSAATIHCTANQENNNELIMKKKFEEKMFTEKTDEIKNNE